MSPYDLLHLSSVQCEAKVQFSGRSKWVKLPETESKRDVWSIKPPDFSPKLYRSLSVPQKKGKKTHSNVAAAKPTETKRRIFLPSVSYESYRKKDPPKFITSYRPPDALGSELMFVKTGKHPSEPYKTPRPHDFRPLDEDLPDIVTSYQRDPGNLNFKLKHLDVIRTTRSESSFCSRGIKTRMDTFKPTEPRWDMRLILPLTPWPPKSASYTRHRRRRGAYSAFLDRVEEKLTRSWNNRS